MIDDHLVAILEAAGLSKLLATAAPFYARELQVLRAVDCCLRKELACFGDMEDRVLEQLEDVLEQGIQSLSAAERDVFVPLWEQLDEAVQLFVLNSFTNAPLMSCMLAECKMRIQ
jgi:hypothetical protein